MPVLVQGSAKSDLLTGLGFNCQGFPLFLGGCREEGWPFAFRLGVANKEDRALALLKPSLSS